VEEPEVRVYRVDWPAFERAMKRRVPTYVAVLSLLLVVVLGIMHALRPEGSAPGIEFLIVPVMIVLIWRGALSSIEKRREIWTSFEVALSKNVIRRQARGLPSIELLRKKIKRIEERPGWGLVLTAKGEQPLFLPAYLIDYEDLRLRLGEWRALEGPSRTALLPNIVLSLLMLASWFGVVLLRRPWAFVATVVLLGGCVTLTRLLMADANLTVDNKRGLIAGLGFMLLAPLARFTAEFMSGISMGIWP
jgi:hypothetical protein